MGNNKSCDSCFYMQNKECKNIEKGSICILNDYKNWKLKVEMCYKTNKTCVHNCKSICRESV